MFTGHFANTTHEYIACEWAVSIMVHIIIVYCHGLFRGDIFCECNPFQLYKEYQLSISAVILTSVN